MAKIKNSIDIDAPIERVYAFMTDPNNLPGVWPSLVETSNVERKEDGSHSFNWVYKMAGMKFEGYSHTVEVEPNKRVIVKNESGIPATFNYHYQKMDGGMRLSIEVDYGMPDKLLAKLAEPLLVRLNEYESDNLLKNVKAVMEHEND